MPRWLRHLAGSETNQVPNQWGRNETYNFPSVKPLWTYGAFSVAIAMTVWACCLGYSRWTPLQRYYLPNYLYANVMARFNVTASKYRLLVIEQNDGRIRLPGNDELEPGLSGFQDRLHIPFLLTHEAERLGEKLLLTRPMLFEN